MGAKLVRDRFDTIPFIVMLAAESADTLEDDVLVKFGSLLEGDDPVYGLLQAFCDRERQRHSLALDPKQQISLLTILASEFEGSFDQDSLQLAVELIQGNRLTEVELERLSNHALLSDDGGRFSFRFSFVKDYLLGRSLSQWLVGEALHPLVPIDKILAECYSESGSLLEEASFLIRQQLPSPQWRESLKRKWDEGRFSGDSRRGLSKMTFRICKDATRLTKEATEAAFYILGPCKDEIINVPISGTLSGFDFSGKRFEACNFRDVEFYNCTFGNETSFVNCNFIGTLIVDHCDNFGLSQRCGGELSESARSVFQREKKDNSLPITKEQILEAMNYFFSRFRRGNGIRTRQYAGMVRVIESRFSFGRILLKGAERSRAIEALDLGGGEKVFKVLNTHDIRIFLDNGLPVGTVRAMYNYITGKLDIK